MKKITSLLAVSLACIGLQSASANLIVNGNFQSGNTGFSSDYSFRSGPSANAGEYTIVSNLAGFHTGIAGLGSLSGYGGSGLYYAANGATSTTQSPWRQTVNNPTLTLTTDINAPVYYRFEARVANTDPYPDYAAPNLAFEIQVNGGTWNTFTTTPLLSQQNQWTLTYADTYLQAAPTSLGFRLRNLATEASGNDFALDNIYFGLTTNAPSYPGAAILSAGDITNPTLVSASSAAVPEPGQVAASLLLLGGIGGYVFVKRRKAAKPALVPSAA
jgi:hypothetical protein